MLCPRCNAKIFGQSQFCRSCAFDLTEINSSPSGSSSPTSTSQYIKSNLTPSTTITPETFDKPVNKNRLQTTENLHLPPPNPTQVVATQKQTDEVNTTPKSKPKEAKDYFFTYLIGSLVVAFFLVTGAVVLFISYVNANQKAADLNRKSLNTINSNTAVKYLSSNSSVVTNSYISKSDKTEISATTKSESTSFSSSLVGREGKLTTNANLRSASNKNALSIGIHFEGARVKITEVEFYDTKDGVSTWYKVKILTYGCDSQGILGCGKNSGIDSDEGWVNANVIQITD